MRQELYLGNHHDIAVSLNNVGIAYQDLDNTSEGLKYFQEALKIRQELYQSNHPNIATLLINVGRSYQILGNTSEGLKYFNEGLKILQQLYKGNHSSIAISLQRIGLAYKDLGNISESLKYLNKALKIFQKIYRQNHINIAESFINLARSFVSLAFAYGKSGDMNKATELYKQSYLMRIHTSDLDHPTTKELKSYLERKAPEFIKNNETREFIFQRGDFEEVTLEVKQRIQKKVLNKIYVNAAKGKWSILDQLDKSIASPHKNCNTHALLTTTVPRLMLSLLFSKLPFVCRFFRNQEIKGYLCDKYLAKQLKDLASPQNIETAKMLCFEAICLGSINHPNRNFSCVIEFTKAYPELTKKITTEHPEYFIDGSILRACIDAKEVLKKLLGSNIVI